MKVLRAVIVTLAVSGMIAFGQSQTAAQQLAADGWRLIAPSVDHDFSIRWSKGQEFVWGIFPRGNASKWSVARDIWFKSTADGRVTALYFQRGFVGADTTDMYVSASDVSCEITEQ